MNKIIKLAIKIIYLIIYLKNTKKNKPNKINNYKIKILTNPTKVKLFQTQYNYQKKLRTQANYLITYLMVKEKNLMKTELHIMVIINLGKDTEMVILLIAIWICIIANI